jgi:hypothetical protein
MRRKKQVRPGNGRSDVRSAPPGAGGAGEPEELRRIARELDEMMADGPHRWQLRPRREPRRAAPAEGPLRTFEVVAAEAGRGVWIEPLASPPGWPERLFVADLEASYALAPGDLFACQAEAPEEVWIWPFWESCEHCLRLIEERRAVQ